MEEVKNFLAKNAVKNREEKERKRKTRQPEVRWTLGKLEKVIHSVDNCAESGGCKMQHRMRPNAEVNQR